MQLIATLPAVRRILAILLIAFLPLQFSWAVVAAYCGHEDVPESAASAQHLGHHDHQHDAHGAAGQQVADSQAADAIDLDCDHCQGHGSGVFRQAVVTPAGPVMGPPNAGIDAARAAHASPRPERPQWLPLA